MALCTCWRDVVGIRGNQGAVLVLGLSEGHDLLRVLGPIAAVPTFWNFKNWDHIRSKSWTNSNTNTSTNSGSLYSPFELPPYIEWGPHYIMVPSICVFHIRRQNSSSSPCPDRLWRAFQGLAELIQSLLWYSWPIWGEQGPYHRWHPSLCLGPILMALLGHRLVGGLLIAKLSTRHCRHMPRGLQDQRVCAPVWLDKPFSTLKWRGLLHQRISSTSPYALFVSCRFFSLTDG